MAAPTFDIAKLTPVGTPVNGNIGLVSAASAATLANVVTTFTTPLSGAAAVTGFRLPRGFRGLFCVIPSGLITGVTGGTLAYNDTLDTEDIPIALAFACAVNKAALFVSTGKLVYPVVLTAAG
tara:strand:- start:1541 stop:1909 length:369 start_codon:yes stop_codon:yes gene_type:complete